MTNLLLLSWIGLFGIAEPAMPPTLVEHVEPYDYTAPGDLFTSGGILTFTMPKSGVKKPTSVSEDYRRAVCDVARIMNPSWDFSGKAGNLTLGYDDGMLEFDCAKDIAR